MDTVAVAFWGAFFGSAGLALIGALLAFRRSARRVALLGALAAVLSAGYALVFLGWVPVADPVVLHRLQALTAIASAAVLAYLLLLLLGTFTHRDAALRARRVTLVLALVAIGFAWLVPATQALPLAMGIAFAVAVAALFASGASVRRGEQAGWYMLAALPCVCVGMAILDWFVFHPDRTPWQLHAVSAVAGIAYLACIATAMWSRYAYLIEVSKVMTQGPNFDPVTRMPSFEASRPMDEMFEGASGRPCGIMVVSISNLKLLEDLHGMAAYNHALFVCATRLRRMALPGVELGRLREDAFVLVLRHPHDSQQLIEQARQVLRRLARPVVLGTSRDIRKLEESGAAWEAGIGIGILLEEVTGEPGLAVAGARAVSRTAWSFPSRMAWYDEASGTIAELPLAG